MPEHFPSSNPDDYEIVADLTGIRPLRLPEVRAEKEVIDGQKVVHAYGTTAGGYIYSFGLARVIANLVNEVAFSASSTALSAADSSTTTKDEPKPTSEVAQSSISAQSNEFIYGLPSYTQHTASESLTALVTGATGVSGYHLVKVLAASPRWGKIYCLSSRPPPENFFTDLGEGADRVEHLRVDFLSKPSDVVKALSNITCMYVCSSLDSQMCTDRKVIIFSIIRICNLLLKAIRWISLQMRMRWLE